MKHLYPDMAQGLAAVRTVVMRVQWADLYPNQLLDDMDQLM